MSDSLDMYEAFRMAQEDPGAHIYKTLLAKYTALLEAMVCKGFFEQEELKTLGKREQFWLAKFDQVEASRKEELLKSNGPEGASYRIQEAIRASTVGGKFDMQRFMAKYAEFNKLTEPDPPPPPQAS